MTRRSRQLVLVVAALGGGMLALVAVLRFLAPSLSYQITDRVAEALTGRGGRPYRIALGVASGSYYHVGTVLNRYLKSKAGYELELVPTAGVPENVGALLDRSRDIHLATIESSSEEAARADGVYGLAAIGRQYFYVIVPNDSPARDFRDLTGAVNPGLREPGHAPTLGEKVLQYYGLLTAPAVTVVRPDRRGNILRDFEEGRMNAATRTQFLYSDLIAPVLSGGNYRLLPIRDAEALATAIPGTAPGFIPAGLYGPQRRIPPEPVPTLTVATLLVARTDLPGRVAADILDVVYDPRFARDIRHEITHEAGQKVGVLPLHPAAEIYYRHHDEPASERIGRVSFVATIVGACAAAVQFALRFRQNERRRARRRLLQSEMAKLENIRHRLEAADAEEARALLAEADAVLCSAERDAAAERLDADAIQALRSVHGICARTFATACSTPPPLPARPRAEAPPSPPAVRL